ncbi:MAG: NADH-quinone oxidoreductase subunit N, partial [Xanthobacteraceae bacterium]
MNEPGQIPALLPVLPELLLVCGAMALLMVGAFRGERAAPGIQAAAVALLLVVAAAVLWLPGGTLTT